jgi:hypothetical protein
MTKTLHFFIFLFIANILFAQEEAIPDAVICHPNFTDGMVQILAAQNAGFKRAATSSIEVTYVGFPDVAKTAFEEAVNIWEGILISKMPIRIQATWESISGTTLGYTKATRIYRNVDKVPFKDVWYVGPLAEAISGKDLNDGGFDIEVNLNSNINWSYSTNGTVFNGRFDLITVVLHEIAHGLGFSSSMKLINDNTEGVWGQSGFPYIYDLYLENGKDITLTNTKSFLNPSAELQSVLTSEDVYFQISNTKYADNLPKIYSPNPFKTGGSISHLDESAYPPGSVNSLMSPTIRSAEAIHDPGELILSMMNQMGWPVNNLESFTVLSQELAIEPEILVYPNPTNGTLAVAVPINLRSDNTQIEIIDLQGKVWFSSNENTIEKGTVYLETEQLFPGTFILRVNSSKGKFTKRVIKR